VAGIAERIARVEVAIEVEAGEGVGLGPATLGSGDALLAELLEFSFGEGRLAEELAGEAE
jgi:hypothetical protein